MQLAVKQIDLLIKLCQACINTYRGKHGRVIPVLMNSRSFDTGRVEFDIGELDDYIVVAFQGSHGKKDWRDNFRFIMIYIGLYLGKKVRVHKGFNSQFEEAKSIVYTEVRNRMLQRNKTKVIFIGHSLGGILAVFFTVFSPFQYNECYTFGAPRGGNSVFVSRFKSRMMRSVRVILKGDPVGRVPFALPTLKTLSNWVKPYWMNCRHTPEKLKLKFTGKVKFLEKALCALLWVPHLIVGNPKMHEPERYLITLQDLRRKYER